MKSEYGVILESRSPCFVGVSLSGKVYYRWTFKGLALKKSEICAYPGGIFFAKVSNKDLFLQL